MVIICACPPSGRGLLSPTRKTCDRSHFRRDICAKTIPPRNPSLISNSRSDLAFDSESHPISIKVAGSCLPCTWQKKPPSFPRQCCATACCRCLVGAADAKSVVINPLLLRFKPGCRAAGPLGSSTPVLRRVVLLVAAAGTKFAVISPPFPLPSIPCLSRLDSVYCFGNRG